VTLRRLLVELARGRDLKALLTSRDKLIGLLRDKGHGEIADAMVQRNLRLTADEVLVMRIAILQKDQKAVDGILARRGVPESVAGARGVPIVGTPVVPAQGTQVLLVR